MEGKALKRISVFVVFIFMGLIVGVLLVPGLAGEGSLFFIGAGTFSLIILLAVAARIYIMRQKRMMNASKGAEEGSEIGFVVDTFHDLVGKLKEKEKELEKLKAFAEEKASRIEAYNENVLQSVPSGVISIDNSMKIRSINLAARQILGIEAKEAVDRVCTDVLNEPLAAFIREGGNVFREEFSYATNDGRQIWLGVSNSALKNSADEKIGMIYVFSDLTDIKVLQEQVELKQRLSQLGEMSAGIAHELRNSMSVISGYAKILGRKVDDSGKATVDSIISEVQSMDRIISELLAFAKPADLNISEVNLNDLIEHAAHSLTLDTKTEVSVRAESIISIRADELLLKQALSNIITNAKEAMPNGGRIDINLIGVSNKAEIRIRDTGCGISEDVRKKIFLPFYTTKEEGIGFGLALVQKIVVSHGGNIDVESKTGEGTMFTLTLPIGK